MRNHNYLAALLACAIPVISVAAVINAPQADQRLIETIAGWCDRYTPWVAIDPLGGALVEEGAEACSAGGFPKPKSESARG